MGDGELITYRRVGRSRESRSPLTASSSCLSKRGSRSFSTHPVHIYIYTRQPFSENSEREGRRSPSMEVVEAKDPWRAALHRRGRRLAGIWPRLLSIPRWSPASAEALSSAKRLPSLPTMKVLIFCFAGFGAVFRWLFRRTPVVLGLEKTTNVKLVLTSSYTSQTLPPYTPGVTGRSPWNDLLKKRQGQRCHSTVRGALIVRTFKSRPGHGESCACFKSGVTAWPGMAKGGRKGSWKNPTGEARQITATTFQHFFNRSVPRPDNPWRPIDSSHHWLESLNECRRRPHSSSP